MLPLEINLATVIASLVIVALVVLATRRMRRRGTCDCHDHGGSLSGCAAGGCGGCAGCGATDALVADLERAAKQGMEKL